MEILVFGHAGRVLLVFPTSKGRFYEYEDYGMIGALWNPIEEGRLQCVCIDGVDIETWYHFDGKPEARLKRHLKYEKYVLQEVVPFIQSRTPDAHITTTGCSFGGFQAMNIFLKYPQFFQRVISIGGIFDVVDFLEGLFTLRAYYNNPLNYLPDMDARGYLKLLRKKDIILVVGENDELLYQNKRLSYVLKKKRIPHILDIWGSGADHHWYWWTQMISKFA